MERAQQAWRQFYTQFNPALEGNTEDAFEQVFYAGALFATRFLLQLQHDGAPSETAIEATDKLVAELHRFHDSRGLVPFPVRRAQCQKRVAQGPH